MLALSLKLRSKSWGTCMHPFHYRTCGAVCHNSACVLDIQVPHRLGMFPPVGVHWRVLSCRGRGVGQEPNRRLLPGAFSQ